MSEKIKRPRDANQLGKFIVEATVREKIEVKENSPSKNPSAIALGHLGGLKGGTARAKALDPKRRKEIAVKAATTRWKKKT